MSQPATNATPARSHVSTAGQVNYWLRVLLLAGIGISFVFAGSQRYRDNPSYTLIQQIMPIEYWGVVFFVFSVALAISWWISLQAARTALVATGYVFFLWSMIYLVQAIAEPRASVVVVVIYAFISATTFFSTLYLPTFKRSQR